MSFLCAYSDVALDLLKRYPAIGRDSISSRERVLRALAGKPLAFASGSRLGRFQRFIYNRWCLTIPLYIPITLNLQHKYIVNCPSPVYFNLQAFLCLKGKIILALIRSTRIKAFLKTWRISSSDHRTTRHLVCKYLVCDRYIH